MFTWPFTNYGNIDHDAINEEEKQVYEIIYSLQQLMDDKELDYQLAPPHIHRHNLAERAITTFNEHFLAGLASIDPKFPMH